MMVEWEYGTLLAGYKLGGSASLQEIYAFLEENEPLSERHLQAQWDDRSAYKHQTRSHISNLCQKGELLWVARGRYSLTEKGKERLAIDNDNLSVAAAAKMIHVEFVAYKQDESLISEHEMNEILSDLVDVVEAHQMFMGGGAHDYGDPDGESCETCETSTDKRSASST
jgi:hypothetical protein